MPQPQDSNTFKPKPKGKFKGKFYKCGWIGHYAKNCRVKEKMHSLNLSDKLKEGLINILINDQYESSIFDEELSEDRTYQLEEKSSDTESMISEEESEGTNLYHCTKCQKTINMLTKNQASTLIFILAKMEESELKQEFLQQLKILLDEEEKFKNETSKIELKNILQKFKTTQP